MKDVVHFGMMVVVDKFHIVHTVELVLLISMFLLVHFGCRCFGHRCIVVVCTVVVLLVVHVYNVVEMMLSLIHI